MAEDLENLILTDVNMTKKSLSEGVQHLIEWLRKQPHLPNLTDEDILRTFIVGSKSVERAKERLDKYFTSRTKHPNFFSIRDPNDLQWKKIQKFVILPGLTPEGYILGFFKPPLIKEEIQEYSFHETAKSCFMLLDTLLKSPTLNAGQILVVDCQQVTMEFMMKYVTIHTPSIFNIWQHAMPVRIKGFICFNVPPLVETFFNTVFKAFFNEKIRKRYVVLSDMSTLSQYIPVEMLPKEYGGNSPSLEELWGETKATLERERDWLMKEGTLGSDETKRPLDQMNPNQIQGTFRKLELD